MKIFSIKVTQSRIFFGIIALILIFLVFFGIYFLYRTTYYVNYLKNCPSSSESPKNDTFCYIKKIKFDLPKEFIAPLLLISKEEGKRIEIVKKRQKAISIQKLDERFPEIVEWYKNLPPVISKVIGTQVQITPLDQPNSLSLVVYEKEGDYIDWHFDTNHYNGRFFTFLIPVSMEKTCGNYQYKASDESIQNVEMEQGEAVLFEGEKVFHRGKELCKNQRRVILSCTFTTSQEMPAQEIFINAVKNYGIFGSL